MRGALDRATEWAWPPPFYSHCPVFTLARGQTSQRATTDGEVCAPPAQLPSVSPPSHFAPPASIRKMIPGLSTDPLTFVTTSLLFLKFCVFPSYGHTWSISHQKSVVGIEKPLLLARLRTYELTFPPSSQTYRTLGYPGQPRQPSGSTRRPGLQTRTSRVCGNPKAVRIRWRLFRTRPGSTPRSPERPAPTRAP